MSVIIFLTKEIEELKRNKHTKSISNKSITYTNDFTKIVVDEYSNGTLPREIFEKYGYDVNIIWRFKRFYNWEAHRIC